jgi:hypothetical protein
MQDDAAQIRAAEIRVLEGEDAVVEGAEGAVRAVLHAVMERVDDPGPETGAAGVGGDDGPALVGAEPQRSRPEEPHCRCRHC